MKKVIYILNLLFLMLSVFGGSVFAAAPTQYIDENGTERTIPVANPTQIKGGTVNPGWNYLDSSSQMSFTIGQSTANNPVNIVVNGKVSLPTGSYILVPENTYVNFYIADENSSFSITHNGACTIGNYDQSNGSYNFGNISFNSGIYTVINTNGTPTPAIGSSGSSGGTITVNAAAEVTANNSWNNGTPGVAVGVGSSSESCTIQVNGGLLQATNTQGTTTGSRVVSAGNNGTVTISEQGKILSAVNPNDSDGYGNWNIDSGIAGYTLGTNQWAAVVGGTVTLPVEPGVLQQNLTPPTYSNIGCWNLLTVNSGAVLNLGTMDPDGTTNEATLLVGYSYGSPPAPATVNNYGTVNITALKQTNTNGNPLYPADWNNMQGSELTIGEDQTLYFTGKFTNSASASGESAGQVTINGTLNGYQSGTVTNNGSLYITQGGLITGLNNSATQVTGIAGVVNSPEGTVTLDGTINLESPGSFQNSGTLDIGPIGTVNGGDSPNLINEAGGTVTSQNSCYYGNQVYSTD